MMKVILNGLDVGELETTVLHLRLVGEVNGFASYEAAQMYVSFNGTTIEIVREIGYQIDEKGEVLIYDGPWSLVTN